VLGHTVATLTSAGFSPNFHHSPLTTLITVVTLAATAAALFVALRQRPRSWRLWLPASWLLVPSVLALVGAFAGEPIELQRLSIMMIPAVALVLAWGVWRLPLPAAGGWALVGLLLALRLAVLMPAYSVSPENWKGVTDQVLASTATSACVAFYPQDGRMPFDYYAGSAAATRLTPVLPRTPWGDLGPYIERYRAPSPRALAAIVASCPRLWFIVSHEGQPGGPPTSQADYYRYKRLLASLQRSYPRYQLRTFGYAAEIRAALLSRP
jgi:hypothetical protein